MNLPSLPEPLRAAIGSESVDFSVKSSRNQPLSQGLSLLAFSVFWLLFTSVFVFVMIGPLLQGQEVHFTSNGVPQVASRDHLGPLLAPAAIIGLFELIGVAMLVWALISLFQRGGYFVGTPKRLIRFRKDEIQSIDWEQFSGHITARGTTEKGTITLQLRTGKMVSSKNSGSRYVPDTLYMAGIPNVFEVERMCRQRIQENDPTPPLSSR